MNHRVLELLKTPKNIQSEDLNLLKEEINSFPYVQNIRALYLYGVHLYDKENYQKVLSATAAYTTDKKILYQLINGKILPKAEVKTKPDYTENPLKKLYQSKVTNLPDQIEEGELIEDIETEKVDLLTQEKSEEKSEVILPVPQPEIKHVYVNGERNRILFEGEENFLEDDQIETIDLESTLESGSIVTQKVEKTPELIIDESDIQPEENFAEIENNETVPEIEEFIPAIVVGEENVTSEQEEILDNQSQEVFEEVESVFEVENNEIKADQEPEEIIKSEESVEFIPEIIIEEENITSKPEKEKVLDESESSFEEIQPIISEVQNNDVEADIVEETISIATEEPSEIIETAEFTPEKIINEDEISSETEAKSVNDESELSFHGTESFLPDVKIQVNNSEEIKEETSESNINKHEDEMRRLIEEVEKKMKEKAASTENKIEEKEPENIGNDISFAETQSFNFIPVETKDEEEKTEIPQTEKIEDVVQEIADEKSEPIVEEPIQTNTSWKPMSFESNLPDSMIDKSTIQPKSESENQKVEEIKIENSPKSEESLPKTDEESELFETESEKIDDIEDVEESEELSIEEDEEQAPVMNVSFFGSDISKLKAAYSQKDNEEETQENKTEIQVQKTTPNPIDSNIPGFINTWQSWLKIDRTEEVVEDKTEIKNKVIETFIENNPKISQLKDESSYVVKEKNDDISHLMTETLASLYFEQKLYTKAIKAFEILISKNPEKKEYYEGKIQEIKDFRSR